MSETLPFSKYHGAGNDFVIVDARATGPAASMDHAALALRMCDRHYGIGADGLLIAADPTDTAPFRMRMFNPDGSESEMCGNGLRCFALWLAAAGELSTGSTDIQTGAGILRVERGPDGTLSAWMGVPVIQATDLQLMPDVLSPVLALSQPLPVTTVSMGNPHAIFIVDDVAAIPLEDVGPLVENHPHFPHRTNVEFVQRVAPDRLRVRVWERGAGATLACGTGACAAMVAAHVHGLTGHYATVELPGGELTVSWAGPGEQVILSGPTVRVFDGVWPLVEMPVDAGRLQPVTAGLPPG